MVKVLQYTKVKKFLENSVFTVYTWINRYLSHDKSIILIHINDEFRDNNKYLLEYLIENGYNKKYRIICSCGNSQDYSSIHIDNVRFTNVIGGIKAFLRAGNVFYCIGKIPAEPGRNQTVMQMWHGAPLKNINNGHVWNWRHYTWLLATSKHFASVFNQMCDFPLERIFIGGYPRCDALFKGNPHYDFGNYDKIILWAPTFRKSTYVGFGEFEDNKTIVPILQPDDYVAFDEYLASINVKVVAKLHPLQYVHKQQLPTMSHFTLLSHPEFLERKMDLYRFLVQCDALITDYSSIFFDYLLLDRPIAFTEDDVDEYGAERGFAVDDPDSYKPGFRIKTKEELMHFCEDVANGKDGYKQERERVNHLTNDYRNGGFCQRILDKMGIKK